MEELVLKKNNFNKLFYALHEYKNNHSKRFILNRGGFGSGKSVATAQYILTRCLKEKSLKVLVAMKHGNHLRKTVMEEFDTQINNFKLGNEVIKNLSEKTYRFYNNSVILFIGLDDYEKLKGIPNVSLIYIEEASNINLKDFEALDGRLRGNNRSNKNRQIILNFNPTSITNWIYQRFYKEKDPKAIYTKTTFDDNKFIDENYKQSQKRYKDFDYNEYLVRVLGEWGTAKTGNELLSHFKEDKHLTDISYNEELPLHLSFDENVNPYLTLIIGQLYDKTLVIIDEILKTPPQNNLRDLLETFDKEYNNHREGIFIYGDATSLKNDVKIEGNFYDIVEKRLSDYHPQRRIPKKNPSVSIRSSWMNEVFFDGTKEGLKFLINENQHNTINDLKNVKQNADGTLMKKKIKDPKTGVSYEENGHITDAFAYMTTSIFESKFLSYTSGGKVNLQALEYFQESKKRF